MEAKKKLADLTKSLNDKIFEFTHSEYDVKLRDINREYNTLIEQAKKVFTEKGKLNEAIKAINAKRQEEIDALDELDEKNKQAADSTSDLKDKTKELGDETKKTAEAVKETGETGVKAFESITVSIAKAGQQLHSFTEEAVAAAIANIKMKYYPAMMKLQDAVNESMGYGKKIAEANLALIKKNMQEQIDTILYGLKVYNQTMGQMTTSGSSSSFGSYQTGTDYVPKTGLYMLHKGEAVIPANQNTTNNNNTFSPNITINASGNSNAQDIAYEVKKVLEDSARQFKRTGYELIPGMG
jgi:hypothetical protein